MVFFYSWGQSHPGKGNLVSYRRGFPITEFLISRRFSGTKKAHGRGFSSLSLSLSLSIYIYIYIYKYIYIYYVPVFFLSKFLTSGAYCIYPLSPLSHTNLFLFLLLVSCLFAFLCACVCAYTSVVHAYTLLIHYDSPKLKHQTSLTSFPWLLPPTTIIWWWIWNTHTAYMIQTYTHTRTPTCAGTHTHTHTHTHTNTFVHMSELN